MSKTSGNHLKKCLKKRLDFSLDARKHEIDSLWQRTTYHSVIVGALFVARYSITNIDPFIKLLLDGLLILVSFIWYISGRGSKFWQEA